MLHECVERVPENVDAAKELLQYGLKGTDLEALIAIGKGEDGGRYKSFFSSLTIDLLCLSHFVYPLFFSVISLPSPRFIMPGDVELDDLPYEDILSDEQELEMKKEREDKKRRELLAKVDFSRYTASQTAACLIKQQMDT